MSEQIIQPGGAQISEEEFALLVKEYRPFLLGCASRAVNRFITDQDEEWSVALQAFYEAVNAYDPSKGGFRPFVSVIVRRRVTDHLREQYRHREEEEEIPETLASREEWPGEYTIRDEIEAVQDELAAYGFSFFDLEASSPKARKSKKKCAAAAAVLLSSGELMKSMERSKTLPIKELVRQSGISEKVLEKHRRYIIAAAVILNGDYPLLAEYLHTIREEIRS